MKCEFFFLYCVVNTNIDMNNLRNKINWIKIKVSKIGNIF